MIAYDTEAALRRETEIIAQIKRRALMIVTQQPIERDALEEVLYREFRARIHIRKALNQLRETKELVRLPSRIKLFTPAQAEREQQARTYYRITPPDPL